MSLERAIANYDLMQHPCCYTPEPKHTKRELYAHYWEAITGAMNRARLNACCETLGSAALASEWSSVDVSLGVVEGCQDDVPAMLRAGADAAEKWLKEFGQLL